MQADTDLSSSVPIGRLELESIAFWVADGST